MWNIMGPNTEEVQYFIYCLRIKKIYEDISSRKVIWDISTKLLAAEVEVKGLPLD